MSEFLIKAAFSTLGRWEVLSIDQQHKAFPMLVKALAKGNEKLMSLNNALGKFGVDLEINVDSPPEVSMNIHGEEKRYSTRPLDYYESYDDSPMPGKLKQALEDLSDMLDYAANQLLKTAMKNDGKEKSKSRAGSNLDKA